MKAVIVLSLVALLYSGAFGQQFKKQFDKLASKRDTAGEIALLKKWEATSRDDAELYVAYFNYYVDKSRQSFLGFTKKPKDGENLQVMDLDTTKKDPVAFLSSNVAFDPELIKKGFEYADTGITKHPSRLDIRFGKVYMFGELEDWDNYTAEIIKAVNYSAGIKNKWTWADDKPRADAKRFMLSSVHSYQLRIYNTENDSLLKYMKQISEAVLLHYPDHVESLSDLAIVHLLNKEYDKALELLLKAKAIAPTDFIVLSNIAQAYKSKGDTANAIKYYQLVLKYGDEEGKEYARLQIKELKK